MKLAHIDLGKLSVSAANMRHGRKAPDVSDILPTVRARGVLVPLLVRPCGGGDDRFEIVAGRRRFHAARTVADEQRASGGEIDPVPCAIIEAGDDAAAVEASLIENIARLDPDEVAQWVTFTRLVTQGRTIEEIGRTFGLPDLTIRRILALGNLLPRIRDLYRTDAIDTRTVRHLTLATKAQQREWLSLYDSEGDPAPTGARLKAWLLGGVEIATKVALFPLDAYPGRIVTDLFGEDGCFADAETFWRAQNEAIVARIEDYRQAGWADVELLEKGRYFHAYEHEKTARTEGGKVFVTVGHNGAVEFHEGWLTGREARRARAGAAKSKATGPDAKAAEAARPETTSGLQRYVDLHRHAAVRAVLLDHPGVALRLMVAHAIAGSSLWSVRLADQRSGHAATDESVETCAGETLFDTRRRAALALLGASEEAPTVVRHGASQADLPAIFARLLALDDAQTLAVLAVVMGETLAVESAVVDLLGACLNVDMAALWTADDAFFAGLRDRRIVNAMLRDVGGRAVADAHLTATAKAQKAILRDCLAGTNQRRKVGNWVPRWLAFPAAAYAARPLPTLDRWRTVQALAKTLPALAAAERPASAATGDARDATPSKPEYAIAAE